MTDMKSGGIILKTDQQGRVRTPIARREALLDEFERSGLSGQKFAAVAGLKYQTFAAWMLKRRRQREAGAPVKPAEPARWLEAVVEAATPPVTGLVLQLPGGVRVEVADEKQMALAVLLVRTLAGSC